MEKKTKISWFISIIFIIAIVLILFLFNSTRESEVNIGELQEYLDQLFPTKTGPYAVEAKLIKEIPIPQEDKEFIIDTLSGIFCEPNQRCNDVVFVSANVILPEDKCIIMKFLKVDGDWKYVDEDNADDSYCE